tara:strand:+ start:163 stop:423 length:261 start_codon:yes stop_codon:yes gene_type:complete
MSNLKKERLNQMIENALSYDQQVKLCYSNALFKNFKDLILKCNLYGLTFASLIISCIFISPILISRNLVDVDDVNDYVTLRIIDDL